MPSIAAEPLRAFARRTLEAVGSPSDAAAVVGDSLVAANLAGHDSHGVLRLPQYVGFCRDGRVDPARRPAVIRTEAATATIDAAGGWGQPAMWLATETALELASRFGLGAAVVNHCAHIGRVAPYVEAIARAGMIGLALANAGPAVASYGGRSRVMGTNPIAWAVPRGDGKEPVCLDVATAAVAEGKLRVARGKGEPVPPDCVVTVDGHPTRDPQEFYAGGALLPFGGHKGSGFSLLAQFVGRGLAELDPTPLGGPRGMNGPFVLAINVAPFVPLAAFLEQTEAQCAAVTGSAPAEGFAEVLLPGEPELRARERRLAEGVPIPTAVWDDLGTMAASLGIELPPPLAARA
jgi:LDH2 family malate/lactate/ureidoglycolate dehydrogenase